MAKPPPRNPFESTFELLVALRDEIQDVKRSVETLQAEQVGRFHKVEAELEEQKGKSTARFGVMDAKLDQLKENKGERFERMWNMVQDMSAARQVRFERLEAAWKSETSDRFSTIQTLDKRLRSEVAGLRAHCERTEKELNGHKSKVDATVVSHKRVHDDLRQDVEKLAALLSQNSMAWDPFQELGYGPGSPGVQSPDVSLGSTANGSSLPPLREKKTRPGSACTTPSTVASPSPRPISPPLGANPGRPVSASQQIR